MWLHMAFVSSIHLGEDAFWALARCFEGQFVFGKPFPVLVSLVGAVIFAIVVLHAALALPRLPASWGHYRVLAAHMGGMRHTDTNLWAVQASLGNSVHGAGDNEDVHFEDRVRGSDWGCDQVVARLFTHTAPKAVRELAAWSVPWNRVREGAQEVVIDGKRTSLQALLACHDLYPKGLNLQTQIAFLRRKMAGAARRGRR
jgi:hypothetical protein